MSWSFSTEPEFERRLGCRDARRAVPTDHIPTRRAAALELYGPALDSLGVG